MFLSDMRPVASRRSMFLRQLQRLAIDAFLPRERMIHAQDEEEHQAQRHGHARDERHRETALRQSEDKEGRQKRTRTNHSVVGTSDASC